MHRVHYFRPIWKCSLWKKVAIKEGHHDVKKKENIRNW
uniref:Uncharacterized protein n=1 Tax=Rhizophora mucronata TaxID=61149 RepID=A0A2P2QM90_RHIMU